MWLVFDCGTSSTKACLLSDDFAVVQSASASYETQVLADGMMEQNADDWWLAVVKTVQQLDLSQVQAIVLTGQMQDVILLDSQGVPVRPVILYSDTRARAEAEWIESSIGRDTLYHLTGNYQDAGGLLAKLAWLTRHDPALAKAQTLLLGAADYLAYQMTGKAVTDTTTASTTGLLNLETRQWLDESVFAQVGLDSLVSLLPALIHGGAKVGTLTQTAAERLNLPVGIPVYHAPGDAGANTLGAGAGVADLAYAYIGTSGWVAFTAPNRAIASGVITLAHPHPDAFIQVAPLMTAGGNLAWVKNLFQAADFAAVIQQAFDRPPATLLYLPYLRGERSPFSDPLAQAAFVGITDQTDKADFYRAVLEGVVFAYRHCLEALCADPIEKLTLTGGGTQSDAWCQLFADVLQIPVVVAAEPEYGAVRGALLSVLVAEHKRPSYAFALQAQTTLTPQPALRETYTHQYHLFRALYPALQPIFAQK